MQTKLLPVFSPEKSETFVQYKQYSNHTSYRERAGISAQDEKKKRRIERGGKILRSDISEIWIELDNYALKKRRPNFHNKIFNLGLSLKAHIVAFRLFTFLDASQLQFILSPY